MIDGTHLSQFVPNIVQEKVKQKTGLSSSTPNLEAQTVKRVSGMQNSTMSLNRNNYKSNRSLNSGLGSNNILKDALDDAAIFDIDHSDYLDHEEYQGVCVMIELPQYTNLIQELSDRGNVSSQTVARSIEVYLSKVRMSHKVLDIFIDHGADLVRFRPNRIVCVWRDQATEYDYTGLVHDTGSLKSLSLKKLGAVAILTCILARNYLKESEVWALEDISEEFIGYKIECRIGVGLGTILDGYAGIGGFRMEHLVAGTAYETAYRALLKTQKFGDINVAESLYITKDLLKESNVELLKSEDMQFVVTSDIPIDPSTAQEIFLNVFKNIVFYDEDQEPFSNPTMETYLSDAALTLMKVMKKEKKTINMCNGQWLPCVFIAIRVQTHASEGAESMNAYSYMNAYQQYLELILKSSRKYDVNLHTVDVLDNKDLLVTNVSFGVHQVA
jgi:hypothetical protein